MAIDRPRATAALHAAPSRALCVQIALSRFYCRYLAFACCKRVRATCFLRCACFWLLLFPVVLAAAAAAHDKVLAMAVHMAERAGALRLLRLRNLKVLGRGGDAERRSECWQVQCEADSENEQQREALCYAGECWHVLCDADNKGAQQQ
eukprot:3702404-Rhodomonas_salina.1